MELGYGTGGLGSGGITAGERRGRAGDRRADRAAWGCWRRLAVVRAALLAGVALSLIAGLAVARTARALSPVTVNPGAFSPNGDGAQDTTTITATPAGAVAWDVKVRDGNNAVVRSWSGVSSSISVVWDGLDGSGSPVPDGLYTVEVTAWEAGGPDTKTASVAVDRAAPTAGGSVSHPAFSPNGDGSQDTLGIAGTASDPVLPHPLTPLVAMGAEVRRSSDDAFVTSFMGFDAGGGTWAVNASWDGKDSSGNPVGEGQYKVYVFALDQAGNLTKQLVGTVALDKTAPPAPSGAGVNYTLFSPNGDGTRDAVDVSGTVSNDAQALTPVALVAVIKRHSDGGLVRTVVGSYTAGGTSTASWDGRDGAGSVQPSGQYDVYVYARDQAGNVSGSEQFVQTVSLDVTPPSVSDFRVDPYIFSPDGDGWLDTVGVTATVTDPVTPAPETPVGEVRVEVRPYGGGAALRTWTVANAPQDSVAVNVTWDGKDQGGNTVAPGKYDIVILAKDTENNAVEVKRTVRVAGQAPSGGTLPGEEGPYDLKALVFQRGTEGPGKSSVALKWSGEAANGGSFTPDGSGFVTFTVYRHKLGDGRRFVAIGQCRFNPATKQVVPVGSADCSYDSLYGYVTFVDSPVDDYTEYSYYVSDNDDADPADFVSKVIVRAFPPTQTRHGNYTEYTNACTACHGLHSSKFKKLLKGPSVTDLCGTCHDGTGSKYDEVRGKVRLGPSWQDAAYAAAGPFGDRLKAGSGVQATSVHNVMRAADPTQGIDGDANIEPDSARVWMAPGSTWTQEGNPNTRPPVEYRYVSNDWTSWLVCTSCHEPHDRGKNFRILRPIINDRTNIALRGVSEVDLAYLSNPVNAAGTRDGSADRGNWERRAMYTKFLAGGNSVLSYYDPRVEDPAWAGPAGSLWPDGDDFDRDGNTSEPLAKAYCDMITAPGSIPATGGSSVDSADPSNGYPEAPQYRSDPLSGTGVRCRAVRALGGVTSFCTACHRTFIWSEAWMGKLDYVLGSGEYSGNESAQLSNGVNGGFFPSGQPGDTPDTVDTSVYGTLGRHKHPISIPPIRAWEDGRLVDGPLASTGDICTGYEFGGPDAAEDRCRGAGQGRLRDPVVPLEGQREAVADPALNDTPVPGVNAGRAQYARNILMCLTCHVAHGSGSERLEVAYRNLGLNNTTGASRDQVTGYLWNRHVPDQSFMGAGEIQHPASPGAIVPRTELGWPRGDLYLPDDSDYWTQYGLSSALGRFNPFASACYRCHSITPKAWGNVP